MSSPDVYAVAGWPVLHSRSPAMFGAEFAAAGRNAVYTRLVADTAEEVLATAAALDLRGLSITAPFKETILPLLDEVDEAAQAVGAVNTVARRQGRTYGFNTDVNGVLAALGDEARGADAVVVGAGGAARAAVVALVRAGANHITVVNRSPGRAAELARSLGVDVAAERGPAIRKAAVVVHALPGGAALVEPGWLRGEQTIVDAAYHDSAVAALARAAGARYVGGEVWLAAQGAAAYAHLTESAPQTSMALAEPARTPPRRVLLAGMMGVGKTAVGRLLAARLGVAHVDTDAEVERRAGKSIGLIFRDEGEAAFRALERSAVAAALALPAAVVSLGGGAPTDPTTRAALQAERGVFWLWASPEVCARRTAEGELRPLRPSGSPTAAIEQLLTARRGAYAEVADLVVNTETRTPGEVAERLEDEIRSAWQH